ncbi:MAG TPA: HNH endonuclease [Candidatus Bathyarchaeota archaeon]|nr:HNH endonuclease [Candidatus Bathyarchaeota archaeon]
MRNEKGQFVKGNIPIMKGKQLPHLTGENACHWGGGKIEKECAFCMKRFSVYKGRKDTALYCSRSCFAKASVGKKAKHWKGGLSSIGKIIRGGEQYNEWRKFVYKRDNWTCQKCLIKQKHPIAHHIKNFAEYPELRFDINNGITLCRSCHKIIHKEIGAMTRFKLKVLTIA